MICICGHNKLAHNPKEGWCMSRGCKCNKYREPTSLKKILELDILADKDAMQDKGMME